MIIVPLVGILALTHYTKRYVQNVADFISAGRCARRYLLSNAVGESGSGVCNTVGIVERLMIAGFVVVFWDGLMTPLILLLAVTGFVIYRYRQTRVLTLAQFFEERYSRRFRLFMGFLIFLAGVFNYGIFPLASTLFFKAFLGLPDSFDLWGLQVSTNLAIIGSYLTMTLALIIFGGQITLMITDCAEGIFTHLAYLIIVVVIFSVVSWQQVAEVLGGMCDSPSMAVAAQHSLVDPFNAFAVKDFNFFAAFLGMLGTIYLCGSWQGGHGFRSAARTPHEGRMASILAGWRGYARTLILVVIAIGALTYLRHPDFQDRTANLKDRIAAVPSPSGAPVPRPSDATPIGSQSWFEGKNLTVAPTGDPVQDRLQSTLRTQDGTVIPAESIQRQRQQAPFMALADMLPVGVKGLMLVIMIMGLFAGDGNHIISWGSILAQDVIVPLRGRPLTTKQHLALLRWSAVIVASIAFTISMLLPLSVPIIIWWAISGSLYNGGAGAVLIGGLYWSRGTVQGAWAATILSVPLSIATVILSNNWWGSKTWLISIGYPEAISGGFWLSFFVMVIAVLLYIGISLLTCRRPFDLKSILSRAAQHQESQILEPTKTRAPLLHRILGIDAQFTRGDRIIAYSIFGYGMLMFGLVIGMASWQYLLPWTLNLLNVDPETIQALKLGPAGWTRLWLCFGLIFPGVIALVTLVWFGIGGIIDLRHFFRDMKNLRRDANDDGIVRTPDNQKTSTTTE
jgi:SSS family solute:Na+ symporter